MTTLTEKEISVLKECYRRSGGKSWEPRGGTNFPTIQRYVAAGFLEIVDGRCLFEILKDSMVRWTFAGKIAIEAMIEKDTAEEKIAKALTGHFAGTCCHKTGAINDDPKCECRNIAQVAVNALREG